MTVNQIDQSPLTNSVEETPLTIDNTTQDIQFEQQSSLGNKNSLYFYAVLMIAALALILVIAAIFFGRKPSGSPENSNDINLVSQNQEEHIDIIQEREQKDENNVLSKFIVTDHEFSTREARETAHQIIIPDLFNLEYPIGSVLTSSWTFYTVNLEDSRFALIQNYYLNYLEGQNEFPVYAISYYQNTGSDLFTIMSNQNGELEKREYHVVDLQNQMLIDVTSEVNQFNQFQENRVQQIFAMVKDGLGLNQECEYEQGDGVVFCNFSDGAMVHVDGLGRDGGRYVGFYASLESGRLRRYYFDQNLTCHDVTDGTDSSCFINESAEVWTEWNE